jgi:hypothetical protein
LKPVVAGSRLNKVLIDGGSGLNVLFTKTLKKMKLDITHMLTKSTSPFYGIVPGNTAIPLGSVVLPVTFGEKRENYRTEYIKFKVADFETSYHAILGRPSELDIPEKSNNANKPQPAEEVQVNTIDLGTGDSSKTTTIWAVLDPK